MSGGKCYWGFIYYDYFVKVEVKREKVIVKKV